PPMMFECNPACGCNILTCKNRVVQRGLKTRLQLCKTKEKSWGVITLKEIPRGTYVCEVTKWQKAAIPTHRHNTQLFSFSKKTTRSGENARPSSPGRILFRKIEYRW
ncbi:unnamed protein product, partial [Nesidiocoris tenuis]